MSISEFITVLDKWRKLTDTQKDEVLQKLKDWKEKPDA